MRRLGVSGATRPPLREVEEVGREPLESPVLRGVSESTICLPSKGSASSRAED